MIGPEAAEGAAEERLLGRGHGVEIDVVVGELGIIVPVARESSQPSSTRRSGLISSGLPAYEEYDW